MIRMGSTGRAVTVQSQASILEAPAKVSGPMGMQPFNGQREFQKPHTT